MHIIVVVVVVVAVASQAPHRSVAGLGGTAEGWYNSGICHVWKTIEREGVINKIRITAYVTTGSSISGLKFQILMSSQYHGCPPYGYHVRWLMVVMVATNLVAVEAEATRCEEFCAHCQLCS